MVLLFIILFIVTEEVYWRIYNKMSKIEKYHKQSQVKEYTDNWKFDYVTDVLHEEISDNKITGVADPLVDLNNVRTKNIVFANQINFFNTTDDSITIMMNNPSGYNYLKFPFISNDYVVGKKDKDTAMKLSSYLTFTKFPKYSNNSTNKYTLFNMRKLGLNYNYFIVTDKLVGLTFDQESKELVIFINDKSFPIIRIKYTTKTEMLDRIKKSDLKDHILQWGIPGYPDSELMLEGSEGGYDE